MYHEVQHRIGAPKDYEINKKEGFKGDTSDIDIRIPKDVLAKHGLREDGSQLICGEGEDIEMSNTQEDANMMPGSKIQEQFVEEPYTPIKALSTFNYDWRIKARITKKGEVRRWKN